VRRYFELGAAQGSKAKIAEEFGVHRSTITRDIRRWTDEEDWQCPTCLQPVPSHLVDLIVAARRGQHVDSPFTSAAQVRRAAITAIREELPRVLAELSIFEDDDGPGEDIDPDAPRLVLADLMDDITTRVADRAVAAA
jgi:hypothetical protein